MKITRGQLKRIIEMAMLKPGEASVSLALAYSDNADYKGMRNYVLFDPARALQALNKSMQVNQMYNLSTDRRTVLGAINSSTLAVIEIKDHNGLWEGKRVAAEKGYGVTMYELMMMMAPVGFMSDRTGYSSADTHPIWEKYMERARRGEIKLTNIPNEFKIEDAGANWQTYIFKIPDSDSTAQLKSNYDNFLMQVKSLSPELSQINLKQDLYLRSVVDDLFSQKYDDAGYFGGGEDQVY